LISFFRVKKIRVSSVFNPWLKKPSPPTRPIRLHSASARQARAAHAKTLRAAAIVVASSLWLDNIRPQAERYTSK